MLDYLKKLFIKLKAVLIKATARCPECRSMGSMNHSSFWISGYNNLCKQACARSGSRCYECGYMVWDEPDEVYKSKLPSWCVAN